MSVFYPASEWFLPSDLPTVVLDENNIKVLELFFNNSGVQLVSFNPVAGISSVGSSLNSITLVYQIIAVDLNAGNLALSLVQFTDGTINTTASIPVSGTFETVAGNGVSVVTFTVVSPPTIATNQTLNIALAFDGNSGGIVNIYGCFCDITPV